MANILNLEQFYPKNEKKTPVETSKTKKKAKPEVPICQKQNLTLEEAAAYSGIGINRLRSLTDEKGCKFVLFVGRKRLIKRQLFDEFILKASTV